MWCIQIPISKFRSRTCVSELAFGRITVRDVPSVHLLANSLYVDVTHSAVGTSDKKFITNASRKVFASHLLRFTGAIIDSSLVS
jgi:hypothetical protein